MILARDESEEYRAKSAENQAVLRQITYREGRIKGLQRLYKGLRPLKTYDRSLLDKYSYALQH